MSPSTEAIVSTSMVFYAAGVAVGIAEALAYEGKHELACARHAAGAAAHRGLTAAQETTEDLALSLIHQIYVTFGACAGILKGRGLSERIGGVYPVSIVSSDNILPSLFIRILIIAVFFFMAFHHLQAYMLAANTLYPLLKYGS